MGSGTIKPVMIPCHELGGSDPLLWLRWIRDSGLVLRGQGRRKDCRAPKRYDGETLRTLRAERGVGRPPHKRRSTGAADA